MVTLVTLVTLFLDKIEHFTINIIKNEKIMYMTG